jgi:hypothetical protein
MKTRRLVVASVLLTALLGSSISATADEKLNATQTALSSTTLSGYVDVTVSWQIQPSQHESGGWWQTFLHWFRFHAR